MVLVWIINVNGAARVFVTPAPEIVAQRLNINQRSNGMICRQGIRRGGMRHAPRFRGW